MYFLTASSGGGWTLPGDLFLGILQGPGPDSPFGDALGWIVVFFVIVWPILRGILSTAKANRSEHDSQQAKAAPPAGQRARRRRTLEEILEGKLEALDEDDELAPPPRPRVKAPMAPKPKSGTPARFGERPADEGSAPVYGADDLYRDDRDKELVGDPFDESAMERDLVPESKLRHVPSEDETESSRATGGTHARGTTQSNVASRIPSGGSSLGSTLGAGAKSMAPLLVRDDPEVLFQRLSRPLTPWQKAVVLREVLGKPLASRPAPTLTDLPD